MRSISDFLKDEVYPKLDAVDTHLLESFRPSAISPKGTYTLVCPACGKREGFYFPYSSHIQCPRKNNCGVSTSIWDALEKSGTPKSEVVSVLCRAVGIDPPRREYDERKSGETSKTTPATRPGKAIFQVTQLLARDNRQAILELQRDRNLTDEQISTLRLGYYTSAADVLSRLESLGITREIAIEKGYIAESKDDPSKLSEEMDGRIISYWPHPDGDVRIFGRLPSGSGSNWKPKYRFSRGMSKDIPYLFGQRKPGGLYGCEGMFDAWTIQFIDRWGCALGGACLTSGQALYLAEQGITDFVHIIDGDHAGYTGGITSIRNGEQLGITVSIVALGSGQDDVDKLRQNGRIEEVKSLLDSAMNSGQFLACMVVSELQKDIPDSRFISKIKSTARRLTEISRRKWVDYCGSFSIRLDDDVDACIQLGKLLDAGMPLKKAIDVTTRKTGYQIHIEKVEEIG